MQDPSTPPSAPAETYASPPPFTLSRSLVLVGLMGAGKTSIGRRLAQRLAVPFVDADAEIEAAAGCTIDEIFARHGEQGFREGERKVIARLLAQPSPCVLATGGGAFMDPETRIRIKAAGLSIWLRADLDVLLRRVRKRNNRPLLRDGDPQEILRRLIDLRYPVYAQADLTVDSVDGPHEEVVERVLAAVGAHLSAGAPRT